MLIFFWFFDSDISWWRVSADLWIFIVDLRSTEKMFTVDFMRRSVDFRFCMIKMFSI